MSLERLGVGIYKTACSADTEHFGEVVAPCLEDGDVLILTRGVFRCSTLTCTVWSMLTSSRIRAFSMYWAMRVPVCWSGANSSRTN